MPVQIPAIDIVAMCQRALGANVSQMEAVSQLQAEFRASNLFYRSGKPYYDGSQTGAVRKDIDGKPYVVGPRSKCIRCGGQGGWTGWPGYTCYRCGGCGYETTLPTERLYTADEIDRLDAIASKKEANRAAKAADDQAALEAAREARIAVLRETEELYRDLETFAAGNEFLMDILSKWPDRDLTPAQRAATIKGVEQGRLRLGAKQAAHWIGSVGGRVAFEGTVEMKVILGEGYNGNGVRQMIKILTNEGATLVWFTGSAAPARGSKVSGVATVKKHDEYQGVAQTIITRPYFK